MVEGKPLRRLYRSPSIDTDDLVIFGKSKKLQAVETETQYLNPSSASTPSASTPSTAFWRHPSFRRNVYSFMKHLTHCFRSSCSAIIILAESPVLWISKAHLSFPMERR